MPTPLGIERSTVMSFLKDTRLFSSMPEGYLSILADMAEVMTITQKSVLLEEGSANDSLYLLFDGALNINLAGREIIRLKRRGDIVGEMSLINKKPCTTTVKAEPASILLKLDGKTIDERKILEDSLSTGIFYRVFSIILSDKLVLASDKAKNFELANNDLNSHQEKLQAAYKSSLLEIEKRTVIETELKRHQQHLEEIVSERTADAIQAKTKAENANQAKSDILNNISHELRTPLQAVLNFAYMGANRIDSIDKEKIVRYFDNISIAGNRLLHLVDDLLDLAKLEAGRIIFEIEKSTLGYLVNEVLSEFDAIMEKHQLNIEFERPEADRVLMLDQLKIMQVIRNLIYNAIKFSPSHSIIRINIEHTETFSRLMVIDQGIGVPEDELEHIFEKFNQSRRTNTGAGGTGLGLAICREIVNAHQGDIWAENNPITGASFIFRLPSGESLTTPTPVPEEGTQ